MRESFKVEILLECAEDELNANEVRLIAEHETLHPKGYNLTPGGDFSPMKHPEVYARVRAMHDRGEIKPKQLAGYTKEVRERMSKVHKKRCQEDGGRARRQGIQNLGGGKATDASKSEAARAKRVATFDAKRAAKIATMSPEDAAKIVAQSKRKKTSYQAACARVGGAHVMREMQREYRRKRKERAFLAKS